MPSHDTFSRVFRLLDPVELARAFTAFMTALRGELGSAAAEGSCGDRRQSSAPRIREGEGAYAAAHGERVGKRDAADDSQYPCSRRFRGEGNSGSSQGFELEGLHGDGRRLALPSGDGQGGARRQSAVCLGPQGQPRTALCGRRERLRCRRRSRLLRDQGAGAWPQRMAADIGPDNRSVSQRTPLSQVSRRSAGSRRSELSATASQETAVRYVTLSKVLSPPKVGASQPRPLDHREPAPLAPRRCLRRRRCAHPQGQRTRGTSPSSAVSPTTSCEHTLSTNLSPAKCDVQTGAKISSSNSLLICDSPAPPRGRGVPAIWQEQWPAETRGPSRSGYFSRRGRGRRRHRLRWCSVDLGF